jgi:hypothetical protein
MVCTTTIFKKFINKEGSINLRKRVGIQQTNWYLEVGLRGG